MTRIISIVGGLQPSTPTIGTATAGDTTASVAFTPSTYIGKGTITYTATSSPGSITGTASSSPITVTGLTNGTAYTFTVTGTTNYGVTSIASSSSNSITPALGDTGSMFPISSVTVPSGGTATITFSSIPQTYTHLQIRCIARATESAPDSVGYTNFNNDTGANYVFHSTNGTGTTVTGSSSTSQSRIMNLRTSGGTSAAGNFGVAVMDILDYKNTNKYKTVRTWSGHDENGVNSYLWFSSGLWISTSAITSISLTTDPTFAQYSSFALYGIKGA